MTKTSTKVLAISSVFVLGGTGQAKVLRPIIEALGYQIPMIYDSNPQVKTFEDIPMLHDELSLKKWLASQKNSLGFAIAIGGTQGKLRCDLAQKLLLAGLHPITLQHHSAWVARSAKIGVGTQILGMAAVSEQAQLGAYCIVNTHASIDHECVLGNGVHVMPGATLTGCVQVGDHATIGSNATILPRLKIGPHAIIGAGAVVTKNVPEGTVVKGNPAA